VKSLKALLAAFVFSITALPLAAQVNDTYVIPAVANSPGAFGTRWQTQFSAFNPQLDYDLRVTVVFVPTGGAQGYEAILRIPPNSTAYSENLLADLFNAGGTGSLLVATFPEDNPGVPNDVISRSFLVTTNTFNNVQSGTYGQTIPGVWAGLQDYAFDEISAVAHGVTNNDREGWRTNIGAVNLGDRSVIMRVSVYDDDGNRLLNKAAFSIPPMGHIQDRLPVQVNRGTIEFFVDDPSRTAVVFPYVSTIDQLSGDPRYQTPVLLATAKTLYGKARIDPTNLGKRITSDDVRRVKQSAQSVGEKTLAIRTK
jgi:hypothetical protein